MQNYTRHRLKEDKFATTAKDTVTYAVNHQRTLAIAAIVTVVVLGIAAGVWFWNTAQHEKASAELGRAMRTYEAPIRNPGEPISEGVKSFASVKERGKAAYDEFKAIADKYSLHRPGLIARYFAGVAAIQAGDNAAAEAQLKQVVDGRSADLASLAKLGLASIYRSTNRHADAVKIYKDLSDHPTRSVPKATAQLELADLYQAKQQPAEAANIYEQLKKEGTKSAAAEVATNRLAALKGETPPPQR